MDFEINDEPAFLSDYRTARKLLKKTSRGKNPDWYRSAHLLKDKIHIVNDGEHYRVFHQNNDNKQWSELDGLRPQMTSEQLESYFQTLKGNVLPRSCRSLGVVFHINQEAGVFDYPIQDWDLLEGALPVEELIKIDPATVLQDRTLSEESMSFRVYPIPASPQTEKFGCAVATSRKGEDLLENFRKIGNSLNFPIQTLALVSPLLLLSRLPRTLGQQDKAFCVMLRYEEFSFFGFYTQEGELITQKSIKNTDSQLPHSLESALITAASSVEIAEFSLNVFDCRLHKKTKIEEELAAIVFSIEFQVFMPPESEGIVLPIELNTFEIQDDNPSLGFADTESFGSVLDEEYHLQDFLEPSQEEVSRMPSALDMKLLRFGRIATGLGIAACIFLAINTTVFYLGKKSEKSWKLGSQANSSSENLTQSLAKVRNTQKYLSGRSRGWMALELLANLFPLDGSVRFDRATYNVSVVKGYDRTAASYTKTWTMEGMALENATAKLVELNTQDGMEKVFEEIEASSGAEAFNLSPASRNVAVNLDLQESSLFEENSPVGAASSYPFKFNLKVTQEIQSGDVLSIPLTQL